MRQSNGSHMCRGKRETCMQPCIVLTYGCSPRPVYPPDSPQSFLKGWCWFLSMLSWYPSRWTCVYMCTWESSLIPVKLCPHYCPQLCLLILISWKPLYMYCWETDEKLWCLETEQHSWQEKISWNQKQLEDGHAKNLVDCLGKLSSFVLERLGD